MASGEDDLEPEDAAGDGLDAANGHQTNGAPHPPNPQGPAPPLDPTRAANGSGRKVCGAQKRNKPGQYCQGKPMANGRCRIHGGKSLSGPLNGNYRSGAYSKLLPRNLAGDYRKALRDPDLLSAADEVALLRMRIGQLVQRLQTGETGTVWGDLQQAYADMRAAVAAQDMNLFRDALDRMGATIKAGSDAEEAWVKLGEAIDQKTEVAAREWKRLVDLRQVITAEKAIALVTAIMQSVVRNVPDKGARLAISNDVRTLFAEGPLEEAEAG